MAAKMQRFAMWETGMQPVAFARLPLCACGQISKPGISALHCAAMTRKNTCAAQNRAARA